MAMTMKNATFWDVMPYDSVITDILEERTAFIIKVTRIGDSCHPDYEGGTFL
jgi:hypothetical protein